MISKHRINIIIRDSSYVEFQREVNDKQLVRNKKKTSIPKRGQNKTLQKQENNKK